MTHEQKPESAEFRTREAQRRHIAQSWADEGMSYALAYEWANRELREAEARGAAEQRRKDAEGANPTAWIIAQGFYVPFVTLDAGLLRGKPHSVITPLYDRPANVTALEARVKELEGEVERLKKPEFYSVEDQETGWCDLESLMESLDGDVPYFEPVEIDCFRSVPKIWAFYDGNTVHEFATEDEARTASAAAIREGGE
ncbi:hypothetical protein C0V97_04180 [Asaia sp. W19]|uniref:hypothetical protein n=1 Tax=unclassified Asaia TaxID=2685023 RepID=UPI000F8CC21C|nr:hypothetical protein [Asaia sp. W19]RUT26884.1 hypothetical protein C0V97_04180 [Asaia sp. W19]